jgi:dTDP-4-dehydrorhamnose 3,5-epimerase
LIFAPTSIAGAFLIRPERHEDERGFFARTWDRDEFETHGLDSGLVQSSLSWNVRRGTLRGLHYQAAPLEEAKLVSCPRGAVYDVIVDLRPGAPTHRKWFGVRLDAETLEAVFVPKGVAHGFLTLEDDTLVHYQMSERYSPAHARGIRWDDPAIGIAWPERPAIISKRDRAFALLGDRS